MDHAGLNSGLELRRAQDDELAACAALYERVLSDTFTWAPPGRYRAADFLTAAQDEDVHVARLRGRLVGLAALYRPQRFLHSLYVTERGHGVGKALLAHMLAVAGGTLQLKCQAANARAQAFYRREGFRETDRGEDDGVAWVRFVSAGRPPGDGGVTPADAPPHRR